MLLKPTHHIMPASLGLTLLWAVLYLPILGLAPLFDYDETIYAQTALDMLHQSQFIVPQANGLFFFEKPPFTYYLMQGAYLLFGENAFSARLPSALFTLFGALYLLYLGKRVSGITTGVMMACIYLTLLETGLLGHAAILDAVLNFWILLALGSYILWSMFDLRRDALWCAVAMGVAVSIKGPVGLVIPCAIIVVDRVLSGQWRKLVSIPWIACLALFFLCASPWYILIVMVQGWGFLYEFIMVHNIGRALNPMQGHSGAWYYYLMVFCVAVLPWLAWMPSVWLQTWRQRKCADPEAWILRLCLIWIVLVIVIFTIAQTKLPHYISSLLPAVAISLGLFLHHYFPSLPTLNKIKYATTLLLLPLIVLLASLFLWFPKVTQWVHHPRALAILSQDVTPSNWIVVSGVFLLLTLLYVLYNQKKTYIFGSFVALAFLLQIALFGTLAPFAAKFSQGPSLAIAQEIKDLNPEVAVLSYHLNLPSISFYSGRSYHVVLDAKDPLFANDQTFALILRDEHRESITQPMQTLLKQGGLQLLFHKAQ
ncbi:MAG: glycosyltransferase family 39 protein [Mariprofundaceae bacterium]|nr:glycosyltransferase family 39 protein [Mariprofundaceae bacterium]